MDNDLANTIETAIKNPKEAKARREKKLGIIGLPKIILDFIKAYESKEPNMSEEEWLKQQFEKTEYANAWKEGDKDPATVAKEIVQAVDNYETAKKDLKVHLELGRSKKEWLAEQIEIGAANNGKDIAEYVKEISKGLREAVQENKELLLDPIDSMESK